MFDHDMMTHVFPKKTETQLEKSIASKITTSIPENETDGYLNLWKTQIRQIESGMLPPHATQDALTTIMQAVGQSIVAWKQLGVLNPGGLMEQARNNHEQTTRNTLQRLQIENFDCPRLIEEAEKNIMDAIAKGVTTWSALGISEDAFEKLVFKNRIKAHAKSAMDALTVLRRELKTEYPCPTAIKELVEDLKKMIAKGGITYKILGTSEAELDESIKVAEKNIGNGKYNVCQIIGLTQSAKKKLQQNCKRP